MKVFLKNEETYVILGDLKEISHCETHSRYGQITGCYDADCYSLDNSAVEKDVAEEILEKLNIDDNLKDFDLYDFLEKYENIEGFEKAKKEVEEHYTVESYEYYDGSNNRSLILDEDIEEIEEDLEKEILKAFENVDTYIHDGATKEVELGRFIFSMSRYTSDPAIAEVIIKDGGHHES